MRKVLIAALIAAGLGFVGSASVSAAPVNGTIINESANVQTDNVVKVQHWWRRSRHWRNRCHYRRWSRWGWC